MKWEAFVDQALDTSSGEDVAVVTNHVLGVLCHVTCVAANPMADEDRITKRLTYYAKLDVNNDR